MGATTFENHGRGPTPDHAFRALVEKAQYDYGHAGYTGTIAEKHGWILRSPKLMTRDEAAAFIEKDRRENDKWGPAFCVAVQGPDGKPDGWVFYGWASE